MQILNITLQYNIIIVNFHNNYCQLCNYSGEKSAQKGEPGIKKAPVVVTEALVPYLYLLSVCSQGALEPDAGDIHCRPEAVLLAFLDNAVA